MRMEDSSKARLRTTYIDIGKARLFGELSVTSYSGGCTTKGLCLRVQFPSWAFSLTCYEFFKTPIPLAE
jgi:hypothetical protein